MVGTSCIPWSSGVPHGDDNALSLCLVHGWEDSEMILYPVSFGVQGRDKGWCFHSNTYCWADGPLCSVLVGAVSKCVVFISMLQNASSILFVYLLQLEEKKLHVNKCSGNTWKPLCARPIKLGGIPALQGFIIWQWQISPGFADDSDPSEIEYLSP